MENLDNSSAAIILTTYIVINANVLTINDNDDDDDL